MVETILDRILANDHRTMSRVISAIENDTDLEDNFFPKLYPHTKKAVRIGITGPPGAGKSTLVDRLISEYLDRNQSVGVVAVDPTSPFTGGALLGDRVRMNHYSGNDKVFIRSMGSHGERGGLARKAQDAGDVLAASGKDVIFFETVGVGQGENDIAKAVDITIVILVPESGDEIQLMKAGLIEIADYFVINKSDREGAERLTQLLRNLLHSAVRSGTLEPPVSNTVASKGQGITELFNGIREQLKQMTEMNIITSKKLQQHQHRVLSLIREKLLAEFWTSDRLCKLREATQNINSIHSSPYEIAESLLNK